MGEASEMEGRWTWSGIITGFPGGRSFHFSVVTLLLPVSNVLCFPFLPSVLAAQPHGEFIITQGGYLMCKIIIHVFGENDVRKTVSTVLEECEQRKYTSVALPAIGTGLQPLTTQLLDNPDSLRLSLTVGPSVLSAGRGSDASQVL